MKSLLTKLRFDSLLLLLVLALMVGLLMIQANPLTTLPGRDSGFFLYAGGQILKGKLPYIDFWDSKGPVIFYINALGLWLGQGYRWGVWVLEFLFLMIAALVFYKSIARKWGRGAALFSSAAWLYGLARVWQGGNLTEEYALLFNFILLAYFLQVDDAPGKKLPLLLGATFALSFLLRANNTGVQVAVFLAIVFSALLARQYGQILRRLAWAGLAGGAVLGLVAVYFVQTGTFSDMFEAAILYNFFYSGAGQNLEFNLWRGVEHVGWPAYVALGGYLAVLYRLFRGERGAFSSAISIFVLVGWPLEVLLSSLSGKNYIHYFISWMPVMAALCALAYVVFSKYVLSTRLLQALESRRSALVLAFLFLSFFYVNTGALGEIQEVTTRILFERGKGIEKIDPVAQFLRRNTTEEQTVLIWGAYPGLNYLARRDAPSAYLFYPAYEDSPFLEQMGRAYFQDISANMPEIIVDAYNTSPDFVLSLDPVVRRSQARYNNTAIYRPPYQNKVFNFVEENYRRVDTINGFDIYWLVSSAAYRP